ncbi:MAG: Protein-export protein SecB [Alphaproteobacteria bacterium MarineAlpha3_Bin5]|nr:protein-export chaperone SecB [Magnetovibrio sp.]PPR78773.1 MAG: Protein-export protein SecB [Alphaproteobacteria bacterium MarineAlpha3_Bin5]|tara:strand:- start:103 stop:618 length:516 start_codon:yes stop_codon:yes gene_type:complete
MTEDEIVSETPNAAATGNSPKPQEINSTSLIINGQYIKELSFEVPNAPKIFQDLSKATPDIKINVDVQAKNIVENSYEVFLEISANCNVNNEQAFVLDLIYAGVFTLNINSSMLQPTLLVECPKMLFPFARNIIADISRDGGFPPIMLAPVDFDKMYNKEIDKSETGGSKD